MSPEQMLAMLRQAYEQIVFGAMGNPQRFADGMIAPVLRGLETHVMSAALSDPKNAHLFTADTALEASEMRTERMNDHFEKLHFAIGKFPITLHHFTGPDTGDCHCHPFAFTTTILAGGYIEEVWRRGKDGWSSRLVHREPGTSHRVGATSIHRIVELPQGECVTSIVWHSEGIKRRQPRFWRFRNGVMWSRQWDQTKFKRAASTRGKTVGKGPAS